MILKLCGKCKKPIQHPETHCNKCKPLVEEQKQEMLARRTSKYNRGRDPKYKKFYNSKEWCLLKEKKLQDTQYQCEECNKLATEVHHLIEIKDDWGRRLDYNNLKSLCTKCHNKQHGRFTRRGH